MKRILKKFHGKPQPLELMVENEKSDMISLPEEIKKLSWLYFEPDYPSRSFFEATDFPAKVEICDDQSLMKRRIDNIIPENLGDFGMMINTKMTINNVLLQSTLKSGIIYRHSQITSGFEYYKKTVLDHKNNGGGNEINETLFWSPPPPTIFIRYTDPSHDPRIISLTKTEEESIGINTLIEKPLAYILECPVPKHLGFLHKKR